MADPSHIQILKQGVDLWNRWRKSNPSIAPNLVGADLGRADLTNYNLWDARLAQANLMGAKLCAANLSRADLFQTNLSYADLRDADLSTTQAFGANLAWTNVEGGNFDLARIEYSYLRYANLSAVTFMGTFLFSVNLDNVDLTDSTFAGSIISHVDLSTVKGLQTANHLGPSSIDVDTLCRSRGKIPEEFLIGAGLPEVITANLMPLIRNGPSNQWFSTFISYSTKDEEFAIRLHTRMRQANMRVWFAPKDIQGGKKIHEQLADAIQTHDRVLLVLSEHSIQSEWVMTEIRKARELERKNNRRKLFPIRLVGFDALRHWSCFDAEAGKDLGIEVREYFVPDFSEWRDIEKFESSFQRLQADLRAE